MLGDTDTHKYLERKLCGQWSSRTSVELSHRVQIARMRFHKHRDIVLDKHLSLCLRLKFFQTVITPTVMFGLSSLPLTAKQVEMLDILQRKMLRRIVGWTRHAAEPWRETMLRMQSKIERAMRLHPVSDWSSQLHRLQFRMVCRLGSQVDGWPLRVSQWHPPSTDSSAYRQRGRPPLRWDDRLNLFVSSTFGLNSWTEACATLDFPQHEDAYVQFQVC